MFAEVCARMFSKSSNTFQVVRWFPVSAESFEDVPTNMDIIEGPVRYRRRKKWKSRWAVLRRVNPASDVLNLVLYQDQVGARTRQKEKAFISLESFSGLQLLNKLDKHYNVIIAITANQVVKLSFETIDERSEWVSHLQRHFGQEQSFDGVIPNKQKIKSGEATLRFYKTFFSLTRRDNYRHIGRWNFVDLPHYGAVYGAFAFEVKEGPTGSTNMYYFATKHGRELHQLFDNVCKGTVPGENNYVEPPELDNKPQRSISQPNDDTSKPNMFKRAWLRMSQRKVRKKRPRSQSEPGTRRRTASEEKTAATSRELPGLPGTEKPATPERPKVNEKQGNSSNRRMTTPEGYEIMDDDVVDATRKSRASRSSETSSSLDGTVVSRPSVSEQPAIEEETDDPDGYVLVDGMDVEEIVKEAERRVEEEAKKAMKEGAHGEDKEDKNDSPVADESKIVDPKNKVTPGSEVANEDDTSENTEGASDNRGSVGYDNVDIPAEFAASFDNAVAPKSPPKTPVRPKSLETKREMMVNVSKGRRGMRRPPPEIVLPDDVSSPESPYVNSPPLKTSVDYVNIPGSSSRSLNNGVRNRSKTTNSTKSSKKLNPYEKYDGNDDSIYHSVESLLPGNPAYQNIRAESNRSHSYDNLPGHAYTNLPGHVVDAQAYQNIGPPGQQAYVNVTPRRKRFQKNYNAPQLNYIQVEGTDGNPNFSGPPSFSTPSAEQQNSAAKSSSSDYTWIDESRTRLLKETARMHSDLRKENLPKVSKKY